MSLGRKMNRLMAGICLVAALLRLVTIAVPIVEPGLMSSELSCRISGCRLLTDHLRLLPERERPEVDRRQARKAIADRLEQGLPRLMLVLSVIIVAVPGSLVYLAISRIFRVASEGRPFDRRMARWTRAAAAALLAKALMVPVSAATLSAAVLPALNPSARPLFVMNLSQFSEDIFFAAMAFGAAWALTRARHLEEESEAFL